MLTNRLIACFDVKDGRVTKALKFQDNIDVGDPAELSRKLYEEQIDEIVFYDIMASAEKRRINLQTVAEVASNVFVPLTVGGGIRSLDDMHAVLDAGAEKISIDSMAVRNPDLITQGANEFGVQCVVVSLQAQWVGRSDSIPSGYEVAIDGARHFTGMDAVEWVRRAEQLGAGELVVNSIDRDGTGEGFELDLTGAICQATNLPVIASGGAGTAQHIADGFDAGASGAIISSMLYSPRAQNYSVPDLKRDLAVLGANVRPLLADA